MVTEFICLILGITSKGTLGDTFSALTDDSF